MTQIVNMSLTKGDFNEDWKTSIVRPVLKKTWMGTYTQKQETYLELVLSLQTGRAMHVVTVIGWLHSTRSHTRLPICLQEELQYGNKLNQNDQWYIVGIWKPKHHSKNNSGSISCIWHSRSWCLTNHSLRPFWIPRYSTLMVSKLSSSKIL